MKNKSILVTGGAGFIGTHVSKRLLNLGYRVHVIDLVPPKHVHTQLSHEVLNLSESKLSNQLDGTIDAIVHLAGSNIFGRWTTDFKERIYNSRVLSTRNIVESIASWQHKPRALISASAFGFYGDGGEDILTEHSPAGTDFLAQVCVDWEKEANKAAELGVRCVQIRTAHVLGYRGVLGPLFTPFKYGLGSWIGRGHEWFPWTHIEDMARIYVRAIEDTSLTGPINTAAPQRVRQKEFMKLFGRAQNKPVLFRVPLWALRLRYFGLADTFRNSARIESSKLLHAGFVFTYPNLRAAFTQILSEKTI